MKDYDIDRSEREELSEDDRTFKIHGHTFIVRSFVRPEVLAALDRITATSSVEDDLPVMDTIIKGFLYPEDRDRWDEIRGLEDDPVLYPDMERFIVDLVELQAKRPTGRPSDSSHGQKPGETRSTAGSSQLEASPEPVPSA